MYVNSRNKKYKMIKPYTIKIKSSLGEEYGERDVLEINFSNRELSFIRVSFSGRLYMSYNPEKNIFFSENKNLIGYNLKEINQQIN